MGCACTSLCGTLTAEDVEKDVAKWAPRLPMAELMNGGVIKLVGVNGMFNPNSLIAPNWLQGKMSVEDYRQAIEYINKCTAESLIGQSRVYFTTERAVREEMKMKAGQAAVEELNQRYRPVRFTYQQTAQNMQINLNTDNSTMTRYANRKGPPVAHCLVYILYIDVNG